MEEFDNRPGEQSTLAIDNIEIEQPIARLGSRALAAFFDYLFLFLAQILAFVVARSLTTLLPGDLEDNGWFVATMIVLVFVVEWGYFAVSEIIGHGKTLGKKIVGLRVVSDLGEAAAIKSYILRNMLRTPDILVGAFFLALDPRARRLGDRFAGTMVVYDPPPKAAKTLASVPKGWGPREIAIAEAFLDRAEEMEISQRLALAHKLVALADRHDPTFLNAAKAHTVDSVQILRLALHSLPNTEQGAASSDLPPTEMARE